MKLSTKAVPKTAPPLHLAPRALSFPSDPTNRFSDYFDVVVVDSYQCNVLLRPIYTVYLRILDADRYVMMMMYEVTESSVRAAYFAGGHFELKREYFDSAWQLAMAGREPVVIDKGSVH